MNIILLCHFLDHGQSSFDVWQWDINSFFKSSSYSWVQSPWQVGGSQNKNIFAIITNPLHLNKELSFDSSRNLVFFWRSFTCNRIDFINENDTWSLFPCHFEKCSESFFWLTHILGHQIRSRNGEKCSSLLFGSTCLCQESLTSTWRTIHENPSPRSSFTDKNFWEFNGQNYSFLKYFLCLFKTANIFPLDIWFFLDNSLGDAILYFLLILINRPMPLPLVLVLFMFILFGLKPLNFCLHPLKLVLKPRQFALKFINNSPIALTLQICH